MVREADLAISLITVLMVSQDRKMYLNDIGTILWSETIYSKVISIFCLGTLTTRNHMRFALASTCQI